MLSVQTILVAASEYGESAISPYVVGGLALAILLTLLVALITFGAGREHS